jgi:hypothetical protein
MKTIGAALLLAAQALAHSGVSSIEIDGTMLVFPISLCKLLRRIISYPPWDVRIDSYLGDVKRIEWSYEAPPSQALLNTNPQAHQFGPVTKMDAPDIACKTALCFSSDLSLLTGITRRTEL